MNFKTQLIFLCLSFSLFSQAKIKVMTSTTDIKWLVEKIGKDKVEVESLLNGTEDPHFIDAMPHFIGKVASADIFCFVGLELEIGWAPKILAKSGNKNVQSGGKGYCETGTSVTTLEVPQGRIDRSQGDIHPMGNPHYHLGPKAFLQGGKTVLNTLINVDPKNATFYVKNYDSLKQNLEKLKSRIIKLLAPLKGKNLMEYHREFSYFFNEFGLKSIGAIEAVPGVPPSAGRLARASIQAKKTQVALAIASETSSKKITDKFSEMSGVKVIRTPISVNKKHDSYEKLLLHISKLMLEAIK